MNGQFEALFSDLSNLPHAASPGGCGQFDFLVKNAVAVPFQSARLLLRKLGPSIAILSSMTPSSASSRPS